MKRMAAVAIIAVLVLPALVGVACADLRVTKVDVGENDSKRKEIYCNESFYYYVTLNLTKSKFFESINLILNVSNQTLSYDYIDIDPPIKFFGRTDPGDYVITFGPVNFLHRGITEAATVNYTMCCEFKVQNPWCGTDDKKFGPIEVKLPRPEATFKSYRRMVDYNEDFNIGVRVDDIIGSCQDITPDLKFLNCSNNSDIRYPSSHDCTHREGTVGYDYIWTVSKFDEIFKKKDVGSKFEVNLTYNNGVYPIPPKTGPYPIKIVEYTPKIRDVKINKISLRSGEWNDVYVEEEDLNRGTLPFEVTIEDKKGKGKVTLEKCKIIDSNLSNCTNYTLAYISSDGLKNCSGDILFNQGDAYENFSLRLYYNRSKLPADWPSPWNIYNMTIIPFYINFENATVSPKTGNWSDTFNYSVDVNASKGLTITITLRVFDPYREREPWIKLVAPDIDRIEEPPTFKWSDRKPFEKYCAGQSKFYFEYHIEEFQGESPVYLGPYLGPRPEPPEFNNGTTNPNVTIYCDWSNSSTPCNYSVNVTTEDEYKVRLLVKDPVSNDWIPKRDIKEISSTTKNITWTNITPFGSLNMDNITQYIGKQANFTFEYDGHIYEEEPQFPGPELVAAFKDPKVELEPGDEVINYNDTFYYSVNVIGSEKLINISLRYLCDEEWISENINNATWNYAATGNWTPHTWECQAINTWEEVRFDVNVTGEGKPIEVY